MSVRAGTSNAGAGRWIALRSVRGRRQRRRENPDRPGSRKEHPEVDRSGEPAGANRERAYPLAALGSLDERGKRGNQPDPGLCCSPEVTPHAFGAVAHIEPRPAPSVSPGAPERGQAGGTLTLLDD